MKTSSLALSLFTAISALGARAAHAEPPSSARWYGGATLAVAGGATGLLLTGAGTDSPPLLVLGAAGFVLGPPVVHFAHGHPGRGLASLGLHAGAPLLLGAMSGALLGPAFAREGCHDFDCSG